MEPQTPSACLSKGTPLWGIGHKEAVGSLKEWFMSGKRAPLIEYAWGTRDAYLVDGRYAVKELPAMKAFTEYRITMNAQRITGVTSRAAGLLLYGDMGAISTEFINGIPLCVLKHQGIDEEDAMRIRNGALYAIGLMHQGDGRMFIFHGDLYDGNLLVCLDSGGRIAEMSPERTAVRIIDLEHSRQLCHGEQSVVPMMQDLLFALGWLVEGGIMRPEDVREGMGHYLQGNRMLDELALRRHLREAAGSQMRFERPAGGDWSSIAASA